MLVTGVSVQRSVDSSVTALRCTIFFRHKRIRILMTDDSHACDMPCKVTALNRR